MVQVLPRNQRPRLLWKDPAGGEGDVNEEEKQRHGPLPVPNPKEKT